MIGKVLEVRLERGRTFALTARVGRDRVFVRETDPEVSYANPGEVWRARAIEQHRDDLYRIELLDRVSEAAPERPVFCVEPFRGEAIAVANRHQGIGTPEHLLRALALLPDLIEVGFYWEDRKGPFGIFQGVAIRPAYETGDGRLHVQVGGRYLVTLKSSGSRGLYASVVTCIEGPSSDTDERVPDQFEAHFCEEDEWGIYGVFGSFKVRPDRNWPTQLIRGARHKVWTVGVTRRSCNIAFVMPLGFALSANRPDPAASGAH